MILTIWFLILKICQLKIEKNDSIEEIQLNPKHLIHTTNILKVNIKKDVHVKTKLINI